MDKEYGFSRWRLAFMFAEHMAETVGGRWRVIKIRGMWEVVRAVRQDLS